MILLLASAVLALAAVFAVLSTERAQPRFEARIGWPASLALLAIGIGLLTRVLGGIEAVAVAIVALGLAIPLVAALLAWAAPGGKRARR